MANSITFFTNDSGAAGGAIDYVKDALPDVSLTSTSNSGLTSTVSTNPLNDLFSNDDSPRFGAKTLFIKDLVLVEERYKWVSGKPTYRIIWNENFPQISGYVFGDVQIKRTGQQVYVLLKTAGDGFGVTGIVRRASVIVNQDVSTTATGTFKVDGATGNTVDYSSLASPSDSSAKVNRFSAFAHAAANETQGLHDIQLVANQSNTLRVVGVTVYYENAGANIEFIPGTTYNNKTRAATTVGASLAVPTLGSSLGGNVLLYKSAAGAYSASAIAATMIASTGAGAASASTIDVTAGHGASFPAGVGVIAASGTSMYVGIVNSVSTDTLTVQPALGVTVAGPIYRSFVSGQSSPINASLMMLAYSFGATEMAYFQTSKNYLDPAGRFAVWSSNHGVTSMAGNVSALAPATAAGWIQVEGYFSAADVEWFGMSFAVLSGTMAINGLPAYNHSNIGVTGFIKKTAFTDAGPGWNSIRFSPGSSHVNVGMARVNMYRRNYDIGVTFGQLGHFDVMQAAVDRSVSASYIAPGTFRRVFADQLPFKGASAWIRGVTTSEAGGVQFLGVTSTGSLRFEYYGRNFAIHGFAASMQMSIDGVSTSSAFNVIKTVASEGFHTVGITLLGPSTAIAAIDYMRAIGSVHSLQRFSAIPVKSEQVSKPIRMSSLLINGNLVARDPAQLGEYRTLLKTNAAATFTDFATGTAPSIADGIRIYAVSGSGAGVSPNTNRWEMFVGFNKNVTFEFYSSAGRTGRIDTVYNYDGTNEHGLVRGYDPVTGIAYVSLGLYSGAGTRDAGYAFASGTAGASGANDCFFDVIVSDKPLDI